MSFKGKLFPPDYVDMAFKEKDLFYGEGSYPPIAFPIISSPSMTAPRPKTFDSPMESMRQQNEVVFQAIFDRIEGLEMKIKEQREEMQSS